MKIHLNNKLYYDKYIYELEINEVLLFYNLNSKIAL